MENKEQKIEEAGVIAAGLCEHLDAKEQAMFIAGFQECIKWQQKRMYSEQEVLKLLNKFSNRDGIEERENMTLKWLEQFKKK